MKNFFLLGAAALTLVGCPGSSGKCDTGDTACEAGSDEVVIQSMNGGCSGGVCTWEVVTSGEMGTVELDLAETGDTSGSCNTDPNCSPEGFWTEYHNNFTLTDFDDSSETKSINLDLVGSFDEQIQNQTTIFDVSSSTISSQLTVLFQVTDKNGDYADCATYGDNPDYYSEFCTNNANEW